MAIKQEIKMQQSTKNERVQRGGMEHDVRAAWSMGGAWFDRYDGNHVK